MSNMKYSGIEWIGNIPEEWNVNKIKNVINIYTGNSIPDDDKGNYEDNTNAIPYIATKDIDSNNFSVDYNNGMYTKVNDKKFKTAHIGDSLLCIEGGSAGKKIAYLDKNVSFVNKLCCFNPIKLNNKYTYYYLQSDAFKEQFNQNIFGLIGGVGQAVLKQFSVCVPNLKEQKLIADFLDKKVKTIDNIINDLNKEINILNNYKKQVISEIVTKGLNKNVEYKDSEIQWIGKIPKHWNIKLIKNICSLKGRIGWEGLTKDEYISDGPTLITGINFKDGNIDWESCEHVSEWRFNQDKFIQIKNNDLLITKDGTVGKIALVSDCPEQVTLNSGVLLIRPLDKDSYVEKYLYYSLLSDEFWHWFEIENIGNTTIIHLYQNRFAKFKLVLPPIHEQKEIVKYLDDKCSKIDKILEDKNKQLELMEKYKKSVIYEYVTGKKRVEGVEELYG